MSATIITAASEKYAESLMSLIGSLNCNWPEHPEIIVYDLGMKPKTIQLLESANIVVKMIPAFCSHWREHYTWKLWCINNADSDIVIWMDAGICILEPLDEIIDVIKRRGYFLVPNYQFLDYEASRDTCQACKVSYSFRIGKGSVAASFLGFSKNSKFNSLVNEAYQVALYEKNIKAEDKRQKHDQSIISILTYKYYPNPELEDGIKYMGWKSPRMAEDQKVWLQRRQILKEDISYFKRNLGKHGNKYIPRDPYRDINFLRRFYRYSLLKLKTIINQLFPKDNDVK